MPSWPISFLGGVLLALPYGAIFLVWFRLLTYTRSNPNRFKREAYPLYWMAFFTLLGQAGAFVIRLWN